ncbi:MAG: hypothetical protein IM466_04610 [Microcystis sp. M04BS1]|nr:hypothetical protein [Microcystis sp. M04BS1]
MKLATAILVNPPRTVNTKFGQKTVLDAVRTDNNEAVTLWRPANDDYCQKLGKNSRVTVGIDSKGKTSLIEDDAIANLGQPLPDSPVPVKPVHSFDHKIEKSSESDQSTLNPSQKREIAQYIQDMAKLYGFCLQQADSLGAIDEDRRAIATTLYLSAQKKFAL